MKNYSIIIPHYNCPQLLSRLLNTIPVRDDTEVLVIDDKSTPDNICLLKEMERLFPFVTFIYSEVNGGGGKCRNIGVRRACGKYLLFADADDFFNVCLNNILDDYKEETADMIFFGSNSVDSITYQNSDRAKIFNHIINNYDGKNDFALRYQFNVPWSRMVLKSLVEDKSIIFQETIRHNDVGFAYLVGYYANIIKVDRRAIYCVTTREGSVSTNETYEALMAGLSVYIKKHKFLLSKGIDTGYPFYFSYSLYNLRNQKKQFKQCLAFISENGYSLWVVKKSYLKYRIIKYLSKIRNLYLH